MDLLWVIIVGGLIGWLSGNLIGGFHIIPAIVGSIIALLIFFALARGGAFRRRYQREAETDTVVHYYRINIKGPNAFIDRR
ncbi:hypothetical protein [Paenibacillus amylolyticus]|uniref:hypothetical protein n=1 Tax=Paenibacillus amylolyticus TaxID=1451 RepID=UPI003D6A962D